MTPRDFCRTTLRLIGRVETAAAIAVLSTIVAIVLTQVFSRYVLGRPLIWAEETATYLLIWLAFLAASVAYKMRRHIAIQTYSGVAGPVLRNAAQVLIHLLVAAVLVTVITYIPDAMRTERLQSTVGLPVTIRLHWFFTVPTLVTFISMTLTALFYAVEAATGGAAPILAAMEDPSLSDTIFESGTHKEDVV